MDDNSIIEGIALDKDNPEFKNAVELVKHTDHLIFLTGKAGTGKTTFLKYIKETSDKNCVVVAPTGVAAINAGGMTIHSFFKLPLKPLLPDDPDLSTDRQAVTKNLFKTLKYRKEKLKIIRSMELLIIDEVSMVRCDTLDIIDKILRVYRNKPEQIFGGVQVVLIGDNFQLPPVVTPDEKEIILSVYDSEFFFSSKVIRGHTPVYIELKKIYRQKDQQFIDLLNRIRTGQTREEDIRSLNARLATEAEKPQDDRITLCTHRAEAARINQVRLAETVKKLHTYEANISGEFPEKSMPTEEHLELKVGAQVMFVKNEPGQNKRYFNGKIGKISALKEDVVCVITDKGMEIEVERATWENIKYTFNKKTKRIEEEVIGTFQQFPLKLAWAITVHKSQGLTFEKVTADLDKAFAPGQVYVALSRCTSMKGLTLKDKIGLGQIKVDHNVLAFAEKETPGTLITRHLKSGRADALYKQARQEFRAGNIPAALKSFLKAREYRDDTGSEAFRRFISVYGKRYHQFQERLKDLEAEKDDLREEVKKTAARLRRSESALKKKKQELGRVKAKLARSIPELGAQIEDLQTGLSEIEQHLEDAHARIREQEEEIERLRKRKWYEVLGGKGR